MARTYYVRGPVTAPEGEPLDAHTARTLIQRNLEAIYEETRQDYVCLLPVSEQIAAGWYQGPAPILMRIDRDGQWRDVTVSALCCGGTNQRTLRIYITAGNIEPDDARDPFVDVTVAAGVINLWQTGGTISPPRGWLPWPMTLYPDGDEDGFVAVGWLVFMWDSFAGLNPPQFAGFRATEVVDD